MAFVRSLCSAVVVALLSGRSTGGFAPPAYKPSFFDMENDAVVSALFPWGTPVA